MRRKAVEVKEERTEEQDEEDYRQLRARWRIRDAEKAKNLEDKRMKAEKDRREREEKEEDERRHLEEVQARREMAWNAREERVSKKEAAQIRQILEVKVERARVEKLQKERNAEYLIQLHAQRQPIFSEQLEHTEERRLAWEAEAMALSNYKEARALPKKVKTKGKFAPKKTENVEPKAKAKSRGKKKGEEEEPEDTGKVDTGKVLDAVEAKMRREMEEQQRREELQEKRDEKISEKQRKNEERENAHNKEIREAYRQSNTAREQNAAERRLIMQQKKQEAEAAEERKKTERARLEKVREANIARKEAARFEALCA